MARPSPQTDRVVALLELLASQPERALSLAEVTRRLGVNKSTCHNMLTALTGAGWLLREPVSKTYRLGPGLAAVSRAAAAGFPALDFAHPAMVELSLDLGVHCAALAVTGDHVTVLEQVRDLRASGSGLRAGQPFPLRPPLGAAVLAWAGDETVAAWLAHAPPGTHAGFRAALAATRQRGYAVEISATPEGRLRDLLGQLGDDRATTTADLLEQLTGQLTSGDEYVLSSIDDEREYFVNAVNAPVFDHAGTVTLVLSLTGFPGRLEGAAIRAAGERLVQSTSGVSTALRSPTGGHDLVGSTEGRRP